MQVDQLKVQAGNKRWLREASMKRLNMLIKNRQENIGEGFLCADISADDLESSGLSLVDRFHLNKWADGLESGRHCMLALLENQSTENRDTRSQSGKGVVGAPMQRPLEMTMLSATISLPEEFLCDSGYLYDSIFSRSPGSVVREALQMLAAKAMEKSSAALRVDQINLALKQLRVEKLTLNLNTNSTSEKERSEKSNKYKIQSEIEQNEKDLCEKDKDKENSINLSNGAEESPASSSTDELDFALKECNLLPIPRSSSAIAASLPPLPPPSSEEESNPEVLPPAIVVPIIDKDIELFRLQIVTELIKMHIIANKKLAAAIPLPGNPTINTQDTSTNKNHSENDSKSADNSDISPSISVSSSSDRERSSSSSREHLKGDKIGLNISSEKRKESASSNEGEENNGRQNHIDVDTIEQHLDSSLKSVEEMAEAQDPLALEASNIRLKPYLKQLNALKASLSTQLRELEDSRAFISLGISKEATEAMIKKAYHSKAIKLHPDKPGGDTAKFQQLQASYQEILKKKAEAKATEREMRGDDEEDEDEGFSDREDEERKEKKAPRKRSAAEEERERAVSVLEGLGDVLEQVKEAADQCARVGQLAIKWQKKVDKACRLPFPEDLTQLYKIIRDTEKKGRKGELEKEKDSEQFVFECSAHLAVAPLERVCELMQTLSSLAMELPSCGFRYGLATAGHASYMKVVEAAMSSGLDAIKSVGALMSAEQQLLSCLNRLKEAKKYAFDSEEVRGILVQMIQAGFRGNSATVGIAAERAVSAALVASELYTAADKIVNQAADETKADARRSVARKEADRDMCPEDRVFMAEKKAQEKDEDTKRYAAEETKREEDRRKEKEEEGADSLEKLRLKIKSLQVQLRVQNVHALQSLNGETKVLQRKLQQELKGLMLLTLGDGEIFNSSANDSNSQKNNNSGKSPRSTDSHSTTAGGGAALLPPFRVSLLSLLADFIDGSCNELRTELQTQMGVFSAEATLAAHHITTAESDTSSDLLQGKSLMDRLKSIDADIFAILNEDDTDDEASTFPLVQEDLKGVGATLGTISDTDSDGSYELVSPLTQSETEDITPEVEKKIANAIDLQSEIATTKQSTAAGFLMDNKVKVCIAKHLGWMRDLRGEKNLTLPQAISAVMQPTPVPVASSSQSRNTSQSSAGAHDIDEECYMEENVTGDEEDKEGDKEGVQGIQAETVQEQQSSNSTNDNKEEADGVGDADADADPAKLNLEAEQKEDEEEEAASGVRLALLPDFRSRTLWLSALIDAEGVSVMVQEELHVRLHEIVQMAYVDCSGSSSDRHRDLSSLTHVVDKFCGQIVRGVRSAAAAMKD